MTAPVQPGISAAEAAALLALVRAQASLREQITQTAVNAVLGPLGSFEDWWDSEAITDLTTRILRAVQPAQRQMAQVTDAYVAKALSIMRGRTVRPVGAIDVTALRRRLPDNVLQELAEDRRVAQVLELGTAPVDLSDLTEVDPLPEPDPETINAELEPLVRDDDPPAQALNPADPYGRLADFYRWRVIAHDDSPDLARQKVLARAEAVARMDIALSVRDQEVWTAVRRGVRLYRRVLHPERSESGLSCGLCVVASDRVYSVDRFKRELHENCHCEMLPIDAGKDPASFLNKEALRALYEAAGSTGGGKRQGGALKRIRVAATEHGELGPVLVRAGGVDRVDDDARRERRQAATGRGRRPGGVRTANDFAKTQVPDRAIQARAQLDSMLVSLEKLRRRDAAGEDVSKPLAFHRKTIARLRRELGE